MAADDREEPSLELSIADDDASALPAPGKVREEHEEGIQSARENRVRKDDAEDVRKEGREGPEDESTDKENSTPKAQVAGTKKVFFANKGDKGGVLFLPTIDMYSYA